MSTENKNLSVNMTERFKATVQPFVDRMQTIVTGRLS